MRAFATFTLLLLSALIAAAALTYPAWLLVELVSDQPVHRVMHRLAMLFALIGLVWLVRRHGLSNRDALGYGEPRPRFIRIMFAGLACGLLILGPYIYSLYALGLRAGQESFWSASLFGQALLSGLVVAFIEETFFRGALQTAVQRESGTVAAITLPSALYASLHFLGGKLRIPDDEVTWNVGFEVLRKLFEKYTAPLALVDSLLALFAVGVLLAVVRARTSSIAACIGLHASWVTLIGMTRETSLDQHEHPLTWLTGSYDGVIGWGVLAWTALLIGILLLMWRPVRKEPRPAS